MMTRTAQKAQKASSSRYDDSSIIFMNIPFRRCKSTSKAMTPKKSKRSLMSELAGSPSSSAAAWKESMANGLQETRKPKLSLDPSVFEELLTTPERKLKERTSLEKTAEVLEKGQLTQEDQKESVSCLVPSTGRVSLWF